jgi:hypothetical protein
MDNPNITVQKLKRLYDKYEGVWNSDLSVFAFRDDDASTHDTFNDWVGICLENQNKIFVYPGTTDPGTYYTVNPFTVEGITGAAHLLDGWHDSIWQVGIHMPGRPFAHEALIQTGNAAAVWRDVNKDYRQESDEPVQTGYFGIDLHHAHPSQIVKSVGQYSAGCQVIQSPTDFLKFMAALKSTVGFQKNNKIRVSYMLINSEWI